MFDIFIKRPILSLVISLFITILGVLSLFTLPVTQFPDIVPPSVVVTANYTGANAEVSTNAVAIPLEKAINGVAGMTSMSSVSTNNGNTLIQIFFKVGTDPDIAAVNVQNRVTTVLDELPEEPAGDEPEGSEFQYDDYRSATSIYSIITVAIIFLFFRKIYPEKSIGSQYVRANKISPIQIGYYRYLFRLKPF